MTERKFLSDINVDGSIKINSSTSNVPLTVNAGINTNVNLQEWKVNGAYKTVIDSDGYIGIGFVNPIESIESAGNIKGVQFISTAETGTAPLTVISTTLVDNLNADLLDGQDGSYYLNYANFTGKPTIGDGTLTATTPSAGSTNTTVNLNFSGTYSANTTINRTIRTVVGPALTNLASFMTGTGNIGFIKKSGADTYVVDTNTYLTTSDINNGTGIGLNVSGNTVTISNTDLGSSQNIFKNIANSAGSVQFSAGNNNDNIRFAGSGATSVSFTSATKLITISSPQHPTQTTIDTGQLTGSTIVSQIVVNASGHTTTVNTRDLTLGDLGYTGDSNANYYVHPTGFTSTTALSGANVFSRIYINTHGHVTGTTTRALTLSDLGYTGSPVADNYNSWNFQSQNSSGTEIGIEAIGSGQTATIKAGTNVTLSQTGGVITVNSTYVNTTYSAGSGLVLSGTTFNHSNLITAGTASEGGITRTLAFGGTFKIPSVTYDAQGHITEKGSVTLTMPSNPNVNWYPTGYTWTNGTTAGPTGTLSGVGMGNVSFSSIPSASASVSGIITTSTQTIAGAKTFSGITTISNTTESTSTGTGALKVSGGVGIVKNLHVGGTVNIGGNLIVNGSTTTVNSNIVSIDDPIMTLGGDTLPTINDAKDRGIEYRWHDGTSAKLGFFGFDASTGKFTFIPNGTNTSEVFSGGKGEIDANLDWSNLLNLPDPQITVSLSGDVSGSSSATLTDLTGGTISISTTITSNSVALGTNTTGNYTASVTGGTGISITGTAGEGTTFGVAHSDTSTLSGIYGTNGVKSISVDGMGHVTGVTTATYLTSQSSDYGIIAINGTDSGYTWGTANTNTNQVADTVGDTLTIVKGGGINLYTSTVAGTDAIKIEHADTSSVSNLSSNNSGNTFIQDLTLSFDTYGHVTGATADTSTVVETQLSKVDASGDYMIDINVSGHQITEVKDTFRTAGSTSSGALKYAGTTLTAGMLYGGTTTPTGTTRLNYGGYFYPTQLNLIGTSDTTTAATHYYIETGTDGFIRPKKLADVKSEIVTSAAVISGLGYTPYNSTNPSGFTSNTGTVTSVGAGNGMVFTTITGSGNVTLGTPSTLTHNTTNSVTSTTHTHAITNYVASGTSPIVVSGGRVLESTMTVSLSDNYGDTKNPYASKSANLVLASPNGSAGLPTFRSLVTNDISNLSSYTGLDTRYAPFEPITIETAAATTAKTITESVTLTAGTVYVATFTLGNTVSTITINGINVRMGNTNVTTTTLNLPSASVVLLYYDGTYFRTTGSYRTSDSTESYTIRWNSRLQVGTDPLNDYKIVMFGTDGQVYPLTIENGTATTKTVSNAELDIRMPILYYGYTTNLTSGATSANYWYNGVTQAYLQYTANQASGWVAYRPIYVKGTIQANGSFKLAGAGTVGGTDFLTQTLPTTDDGYVYILLGIMNNSTTSVRITTNNPVYEYKDGAIRPYLSEHTHLSADISDATNLNTANTIVKRDASGNFSAGTITASLNGNAATASKLGTTTIGSTVKPIYLNGGTATAFSTTVGSSVKPVYMSSGSITAFSSTVGSTSKPVYMSSGSITALSATVGSSSTPVYMSGGTITTVTSLDASLLTGTIPSTVFGNSSLYIGTTSVALNRPSGALTLSGVSLATLTRGTYLTGNNYNGSVAQTWAVDATSANTASKVVARDASGNFNGSVITAETKASSKQFAMQDSTSTEKAFMEYNEATASIDFIIV